MNLSRAKTALIYAFFGLNLFLVYHLYSPYVGKIGQTSLTTAELQQAIDYLASNNYYLRAEINRAVQHSAFITVAPAQLLQAEFISERGTAIPGKAENGVSYYRMPVGEAAVHPGGLIQLDFQSGAVLAENSLAMEDRELSRLVQQFLQDNFILPVQARFDYIERSGQDRRVLRFYQDLDGIPLFSGFIEVYMDRDRITRVILYWLDLIEYPREEEMEVIPATDALIKLVDELGPGLLPRDIIKVELGYFSREYNAEMWEVPPVWRILMEDSAVYYVNAFTGNLEDM